jgi:DNA-binding GntR family transcriptional regulator
LTPLRHVQFSATNQVKLSKIEHRHVLTAIVRRRDAAAAELLRAHISVVRHTYVRFVPQYASVGMAKPAFDQPPASR